MEEACCVFDSVHCPDLVLWNSMIGGLAVNGHGERALELFRVMSEKGFRPNQSTFVAALCACTHTSHVDEGRSIFRSMRCHGMEPQREHYGCLADLLGRAGHVEEAETVLLDMPMEPHVSQWGALMSSCRMHNNISVGERVGKRLIELEPHHGGRYAILFNLVKWLNWIVALLGTSSTKIIVNEDLSDPVLQRRNLRHCLGRLLDKAQEDMILSQTGPQILRFRASFYADDVIIFLRPHWQDLRVTVAILDLFGAATGLVTNMAKRDNIFPIACQDVDLTFAATVSDCAAADFFCKYLGFPLSGKKLKRTEFQQLIDKLMKKLAWWKARITVL
ncbi:hypothetical protein ACQ4PT_059132 [Festuca glaucescens]